MSADLDALVGNAPIAIPSTTTRDPVVASESQSSARARATSFSSPSKRPRLHSFGASRCTIQFTNKEQAKKLGKRFKLVMEDVYRCENEPIGASTYWNNKRVCKECHDLGRHLHRNKQSKQAQIAKDAAARAMARGMGGSGSGGGSTSGTGAPTSNAQKDMKTQAMGVMFLQYFYQHFKNKVVNVPNGHKLNEACKKQFSQLVPLIKTGRVKFNKDLLRFVKQKINDITKDVKSNNTNIWEYCYQFTSRQIKAKMGREKDRERQQPPGGIPGNGGAQPQQHQQFFIETLNVDIDDIKTETVFGTDVLTETEQYDEMILEAEPSMEELLKYETKKIDVRDKEIHVLENKTLQQRMAEACSSTRTNVVLGPEVEEYMQHVLDYVVRDTLESLAKLSKHREESAKSAAMSTTVANAPNQSEIGYDMHKYDAVWGPLPSHKIHVIKTNGHKKRKRRRMDGSGSSSNNNNNNNSDVVNGGSKQLLHALKMQVAKEKSEDLTQNGDENDVVTTIDESMVRLVKAQLRSSSSSIVPYEEGEGEGNSTTSGSKQSVTAEDMKTLMGRASHKSIYSANFMATLFNSGGH